MSRAAWALALVLLAGVGGSLAQETATPGPSTAPETQPAPRLGLFKIGPFFLTPFLRINAIGLDTNVFYTEAERQTDFTASGGPGLELVLPLGQRGRLTSEGALDYLYFARTETQRRLSGNANARLEFKGARTEALIEEAFDRTFQRPSFEVDARVRQDQESTRADLKRRLFGRLSLLLDGSRSHTDTQDQTYLGTDLRRTLTRDDYRLGGGLDYALTVKTSLVAEADQFWYRFPFEPSRDAHSLRVWGGFRTDATALMSGRAVAGMRWYRPQGRADVERRTVVAVVDATLNISRRTRLGGRYSRDLGYSAFATTGDTPTLVTEIAEGSFDKMLVGNVYIHGFARQTRLISDGAIKVTLPDEGEVVAVRNDRAREYGLELGYQFRPRVRIGATAIYTKRRSSIATFGIEGLLAGLTVHYNPPARVFR